MNEIIEKIRTIEAIQKKRQEQDTLARYNSGEKVHQKQLAFTAVSSATAGCSAETVRERRSAAPSKRFG